MPNFDYSKFIESLLTALPALIKLGGIFLIATAILFIPKFVFKRICMTLAHRYR